MPEPSFQDLSPDAIAVLRQHNLLKALIHAEVTAAAVKSIALPPQTNLIHYSLFPTLSYCLRHLTFHT